MRERFRLVVCIGLAAGTLQIAAYVASLASSQSGDSWHTTFSRGCSLLIFNFLVDVLGGAVCARLMWRRVGLSRFEYALSGAMAGLISSLVDQVVSVVTITLNLRAFVEQAPSLNSSGTWLIAAAACTINAIGVVAQGILAGGLGGGVAGLILVRLPRRTTETAG